MRSQVRYLRIKDGDIYAQEPLCSLVKDKSFGFLSLNFAFASQAMTLFTF